MKLQLGEPKGGWWPGVIGSWIGGHHRQINRQADHNILHILICTFDGVVIWWILFLFLLRAQLISGETWYVTDIIPFNYSITILELVDQYTLQTCLSCGLVSEGFLVLTFASNMIQTGLPRRAGFNVVARCSWTFWLHLLFLYSTENIDGILQNFCLPVL
jgi:hypothetical protein